MTYTHALGIGRAAGPMTWAAVLWNRDLLRVGDARAGNDLGELDSLFIVDSSLAMFMHYAAFQWQSSFNRTSSALN